MYCKNCGNQLSEGQDVCLNCGIKVGAGNSYCANCGKEISPNQAVCLNCGASMTSGVNSNYLAGKDKTTMILICLFIGGLGIHNFMMGETKKGVTRIIASCLCGLGGILALVDLIKICTDNYVVDPDAMF